MPHSAKLPSSLWLCGALVAGLAGASASAFAQPAPQPAPTVGEITVTGRYGPEGEARRLSQAVSFVDLDLTTDDGRKMLDQRIKDTARDLCVRLGESPTMQAPPAPSCQQDAVNSAAAQRRVALAQAQPKSMAMAAPPPEPMPAPPPAPEAPAASAYGSPASVTVSTVTNGPVPDTAENRAKYGGPMSRAGKRTQPAGN